MHTDAVPSLLAGRYLVVGELGRGGTAVVHHARDLVLQRDVAIKVLRQVLLDPSARARFETEGRILARLDHPVLVAVHDAALVEDHPYLVLELVEGRSLARPPRSEPLPTAAAVRIAAAVAEGLAHVHAAGVVHRDVKPANILIGDDGSVRLTDFGIARVIGDASVTATGTIIGTAAYLAPEQVRGEAAGPPADVYALGLVLLELLGGGPVYPGPPHLAALARLTTPPTVPPTLPPALAGLLGAMTAADPAARPSATSVAHALTDASATRAAQPAPPFAPAREHAAGAVGTSADEAAAGSDTAGTGVPADDTRPTARRARRSVLVGVAGVVAAAVLTTGGWALQAHQAGSGPGSPSAGTAVGSDDGRPPADAATRTTPASPVGRTAVADVSATAGPAPRPSRRTTTRRVTEVATPVRTTRGATANNAHGKAVSAAAKAKGKPARSRKPKK